MRKPSFLNPMVLTLTCLQLACGTPQSGFRVITQSDSMIGVQAVKNAKEIEIHELAVKECKKVGKSSAAISETRTTLNDQFPMIYIYQCIR